MSKKAFLVSLLVTLIVCMASSAQAKRIALVIGNDEYVNVDRRTLDQQLNHLNSKTDISADETLWATVENSKKASDFQFYLSKFPKGRYTAEAELKIIQHKNPLTRSYNPGDTFKDCDDCPEMVVVPSGRFMMGSPKSENERYKDEGPRHEVTIANKFAVGQFEVTRAQFSTFVNETGHDVGNKCSSYAKGKWKEHSNRSYEKPGFHQDDTHPVVCVNWDDAKAYVRWLSRKTKKKYRLLSEAEWEYVARANTETPFWWGKSISRSQANYSDNPIYNGYTGKDRKPTVPVDSFEANDFGLYNVHGNVLEWVEDCWHESYHGSPKDGRAWIKGGECSKRVLRGGSWYSNPDYLRLANRFRLKSDIRIDDLGFRVSRTLVGQGR